MEKDFRHVCFKDLEAYRKKDDLFDDLSPYELSVIQSNLEIESPEIYSNKMSSFNELFE